MAVRNLIGVVPQELALYDDLSARENLRFWGRMYGLSGRALKRRVAEVLEQIGLADRAKERVKAYSGGMKRRVNIRPGPADHLGHAWPARYRPARPGTGDGPARGGSIVGLCGRLFRGGHLALPVRVIVERVFDR
jgi:hypothetical protein